MYVVIPCWLSGRKGFRSFPNVLFRLLIVLIESFKRINHKIVPLAYAGLMLSFELGNRHITCWLSPCTSYIKQTCWRRHYIESLTNQEVFQIGSGYFMMMNTSCCNCLPFQLNWMRNQIHFQDSVFVLWCIKITHFFVLVHLQVE
jgi:hypothetical protein